MIASSGGDARERRPSRDDASPPQPWGAPPEHHDTSAGANDHHHPIAPRTAPLRVVLTGAESTGKTELARALAARYGVPWSAEEARGYLAARQAAGSGELTAADVEPIARGQRAGEDAAIATARAEGAPLVLHDTDLVSTVVYATHYYGGCPAWIERAARERAADLYLLCDTDLPWQPDAQRDADAAREAIQARFRRALSELGVRVARVRGAGPAREAAAVAAIDAALDRR